MYESSEVDSSHAVRQTTITQGLLTSGHLPNGSELEHSGKARYQAFVLPARWKSATLCCQASFQVLLGDTLNWPMHSSSCLH